MTGLTPTIYRRVLTKPYIAGYVCAETAAGSVVTVSSTSMLPRVAREYLTGETSAAETKYGPAPTVAELLKQGKTSPAKATPAKTAPVRKPAAKQ